MAKQPLAINATPLFALPRVDKPAQHAAQGEATSRQRQRRREAVGVNGNDGQFHRRVEKVQRHHQRVIEAQLVGGGEVEVGMHSVSKNRLGQPNMPAHRVARHGAPGLLRPLSFLRHADTERRQVIVEEINEMIAIDLDDQIGLRLLHLLANLLHERLSAHLSRRLGHLVNEPGRMGNSGR
jgi:hypothetical protein